MKSNESLSKNSKPLFRELLEICVCGHGKVWHNGKFGECRGQKGHYKDEKLCYCPVYKQNLNDFRNQRIMEWNLTK